MFQRNAHLRLVLGGPHKHSLERISFRSKFRDVSVRDSSDAGSNGRTNTETGRKRSLCLTKHCAIKTYAGVDV
jgi:hypothetical protein